jgi:hypothetical protein
MLMADDTTYGLAVLLDNRGKTIPKLAYQEIGNRPVNCTGLGWG